MLKCQGVGHVASGCHYRRVVTIQEQKEIPFEEEDAENEEGQTELEEVDESHDMGELCFEKSS